MEGNSHASAASFQFFDFSSFLDGSPRQHCDVAEDGLELNPFAFTTCVLELQACTTVPTFKPLSVLSESLNTCSIQGARTDLSYNDSSVKNHISN